MKTIKLSIKRLFETGLLSVPVLIGFILAAAGGLLTLAARSGPEAAEFLSSTVSFALRWLLAKVTYLVPFSVGEALLIILPFAVIIYLAGKIIHAVRSRRPSVLAGGLLRLLSVAGAVYFLYAATHGINFYRYTIEENMGMTRRLLSADDLEGAYVTMRDLSAELIKSSDEIYSGGGSTLMPYTRDEMSKKLMEAYSSLRGKYPFLNDVAAPVKPVVLSVPMTYTHIAGVYSFFTGESNINTNFPDYTLPYTSAHEMAHQRGIAREDEANFVAFLVCMESEDDYIRYSGMAGMLEYLSNALHKADPDRYFELVQTLDGTILNEFNAYRIFFEKYREATVAKVSGAVNDSFLKAQGQEMGEASYGRVVDLAVVWLEQKYGDTK
ncbi:MAG: DUF3810 domain-containing protein [Eubacteriales bacterium]